MKKWLSGILVLSMTFSACSKKDTGCSTAAPSTVAPASETAQLQAYLSANGIIASEINGMFYSFTSTGSGESPSRCSSISVIYTGNLINVSSNTLGTRFDSSNGAAVNFSLNGSIIDGWKLVFPLVKTGGVVNLYIPPSLGYGAQANGPIPANSYLQFTVQLVTVQ